MSVGLRGTQISLLGASLVCFSASVWSNPDNGDIDYFVRGDTNNDTLNDISDAVFLLNYLFAGGAAPPCAEVSDVNDDGNVDISDSVFLLGFLFSGGDPPPHPYPYCDADPKSAPCPQAYCNQSS